MSALAAMIAHAIDALLMPLPLFFMLMLKFDITH